MTAPTTGPTPGLTRLTPVDPTPTGVIRAVEERLDALERDVRSARAALALADTELLAAHRAAEIPPEAMTTDQVARRFGLSRSTVTAMIARGELVSVKIGGARRVLRRDLVATSPRSVRGARHDPRREQIGAQGGERPLVGPPPPRRRRL